MGKRRANMLKRKGRIRLFRGSIEFQKPIRGTDTWANMMRFGHTYKGVMKKRWFCGYCANCRYTVGATPWPARHLPLLFRSIALQIFMLLERMSQPASNPPATTWRKAATPFMCCRTASPATIKGSCRRCLRIMKARAVLSQGLTKSCRCKCYGICKVQRNEKENKWNKKL